MFFDPEQGWRGVVGLLVSGIGHDLNGRLTALMGIAHVARHAGLDSELLDVLDDQVQRLETSIRALRNMPVGGPGKPELTRIKDLLQPVVELYGCRGGGDEVALEVEEAGPSNAIRMRVRPFIEAVLLMLAAAEHDHGGKHRKLRVQYGSKHGEAYLLVEAGTGASGPRMATNATVEEARQLLELAGGRLERSELTESGALLEVRIQEAV